MIQSINIIVNWVQYRLIPTIKNIINQLE